MSDKEMGNVTAIKTYFERKDSLAPNGGRKIEMAEFKGLTPEERAELGALCAVELDVVIKPMSGAK